MGVEEFFPGVKAGEKATPDRGLYGITVAAELAGVGEQTLRLYERKGLLAPARTPGGTRRYSENDIRLLRRIAELLAEGLNLVGARRVLELELANAKHRDRITKLRGRGRPAG